MTVFGLAEAGGEETGRVRADAADFCARLSAVGAAVRADAAP
jgi:hypothetical protein